MSNGKPYVTLKEIHERLHQLEFRSVYWNHILQLMKDELAKIYDPSSAVDIRFEDFASIRDALGIPPFRRPRFDWQVARNSRRYDYDLYEHMRQHAMIHTVNGLEDEEYLDLIRATHSLEEIKRLVDSGMVCMNDDTTLALVDEPANSPTMIYCENLWAEMRVDMARLIEKHLAPGEFYDVWN